MAIIPSRIQRQSVHSNVRPVSGHVVLGVPQEGEVVSNLEGLEGASEGEQNLETGVPEGADLSSESVGEQSLEAGVPESKGESVEEIVAPSHGFSAEELALLSEEELAELNK